MHRTAQVAQDNTFFKDSVTTQTRRTDEMQRCAYTLTLPHSGTHAQEHTSCRYKGLYYEPDEEVATLYST